MAFVPDMNWKDLALRCEIASRNELNTREETLRAYDMWQRFRAGRSDAVIATAMSRPEADIAEMDSAFAAFKEMHDFANNVASPVAGDRYFSLRQFIG